MLARAPLEAFQRLALRSGIPSTVPINSHNSQLKSYIDLGWCGMASLDLLSISTSSNALQAGRGVRELLRRCYKFVPAFLPCTL